MSSFSLRKMSAVCSSSMLTAQSGWKTDKAKNPGPKIDIHEWANPVTRTSRRTMKETVRITDWRAVIRTIA